MLSKPGNPGLLSRRYPAAPESLLKGAQNPVADRLIESINRITIAIRRNMLAANESLKQVANYEAELAALKAAANTLGIHLETSPESGVVRQARGQAGAIDQTITTETAKPTHPAAT